MINFIFPNSFALVHDSVGELIMVRMADRQERGRGFISLPGQKISENVTSRAP